MEDPNDIPLIDVTYDLTDWTGRKAFVLCMAEFFLSCSLCKSEARIDKQAAMLENFPPGAVDFIQQIGQNRNWLTSSIPAYLSFLESTFQISDALVKWFFCVLIWNFLCMF